MTPEEEKARLLQDCDLLAPAGDATTTKLNSVPILRVVKAARAYAEAQTNPPTPAEIAEVKRQLFSLVEDTIDKYHAVAESIEGIQGAFARGRITEAKSIRDAMAEVFRSPLSASPPAPAVAQDGDMRERLIELLADCCDQLVPKQADRIIAEVIAPRLQNELKGARRRLDVAMAAKIDERASRERAEADANRLAEAIKPLIAGRHGHMWDHARIVLAVHDHGGVLDALAEHDKGGEK